MDVRGLTSHALQQCLARDFPPSVVLRIVREKLMDVVGDSGAAFVGNVRERGGLIGSNGDEVWAIVRGHSITTVMLRRSDQPATNEALRVSVVAGPYRRRKGIR